MDALTSNCQQLPHTKYYWRDKLDVNVHYDKDYIHYYAPSSSAFPPWKKKIHTILVKVLIATEDVARKILLRGITQLYFECQVNILN